VSTIKPGTSGKAPVARKAVRFGFLLVALGFGGWAVASQWDAV
jgi:hypothetical protein